MMFIPLKIQKREKDNLLNDITDSSSKKKNNSKGNMQTVKITNDYNNSNNYLNSIDLSQSRIESKEINININLTENFDNSSNISVFPANKKHGFKDSMSIDSHSNNTIRSDYRHHSLNPFNKKGHRIQKIYNMLGHIFDKKIEEIKNKFSSTLYVYLIYLGLLKRKQNMWSLKE